MGSGGLWALGLGFPPPAVHLHEGAWRAKNKSTFSKWWQPSLSTTWSYYCIYWFDHLTLNLFSRQPGASFIGVHVAYVKWMCLYHRERHSWVLDTVTARVFDEPASRQKAHAHNCAWSVGCLVVLSPGCHMVWYRCEKNFDNFFKM